MATYLELSAIKSGAEWNDFLSKIKVACSIKAAAIIDSATPAATSLEWAKTATANTSQAGQDISNYIIATNNAATLVQIYAASDVEIQDNVNGAIDAVYGG